MKNSLIVWVAAAAWAQGPQAPDVIVLNDAALGAVAFQHKMHEERAEGKCETCHHASRPEKPQTRPFQACRECHTRPVQEGMKTIRQAAFHNPPAQSGTCVDCHKRHLAAGKKPPQKCFDCHKKQALAAMGGPGGPPWTRLHKVGSLALRPIP